MVGVVLGAGLVLATVEVVGKPAGQTTTVFATVTGVSTLTLTKLSVSTIVSTVNQTVTAASNSTGSSGSGGPVVESGTLTVPTGSGTGSLVITVKNQATATINEITVTPNLDTLSLNGENPGAGWVMLSGGSIPVGSSDSAQVSVSGPGDALTVGTTYTFTVVVTFSGGGDNVQTLSLTAQV